MESRLNRFLSISMALLMMVPWQGHAQLPQQGSFSAAPDEWLLSNGQLWHHETRSARVTTPLGRRDPQDKEQAVVQRAEQLFRRSSAKAMALFDGNEIVWMAYKWPASRNTRFLSFSVGKTVTAMAVGKAICEGRLARDHRAGAVIPALEGTDLGSATIEDLLKMSSGTWRGNPDSTVWTADEDRRIRSGSMTLLDLLSTRQVSTAETNALGVPLKPGERFLYRSTDPLALGVALNQATQMTYAQYVEQEVLIPAGIERPAIIGQDRAGFGVADGNVRLFLDDWIRFALWVKQHESGSGCFSDFVRSATTQQIANKPKTFGFHFDGYGFLTWTDNLQRRDSYWAVGHGGQRIGWNRANNRMLVAFSNVENYMAELYELYAEWAALGDVQR